MYELKYQELDKLKKKRNKTLIILITVFVIVIGIVLHLSINTEMLNKIGDSTFIVGLIIMIIVVFTMVVTAIVTEPYRKFKLQMMREIKNDILGRKLSSVFGSDYRIEDELTFYDELQQIDFGGQYPISNDYLVLKYNNIRFKYIDCDIYESSDDGTRRFFKGEVYVFDTNESISGDLYIGTKEKSILGDITDIDRLISNNSIKTITPNNSIVKENIILKSSSYCSLLDNTEFQETINNIIGTNITYLIYRNNKVYVFFNNKELLFDIRINNRSKEQEAEILFEQDVEKLKQHLNEILNYKESLHIGEYKS